ncbi:ABC transporter ATP-binding protein [Desulfoscipio sp. XC116]|uniref:ABC transporter ATP-binding protein n=1 Tax=Desulfoscipio sp. XC116 TaxID=3144975 RepID=UPI00325AC449
MFSLYEVVLHYGKLKVLEQFNLNCDRRQFICLLGPSGVGKTSILNILARIVKPQSGQVESDNRRLAYVFQEPRLIPWLTVEQNLHVGLYNLGLDFRQRCQRVESLLPVLGLAEFGGYYPGQLSGGMKQRVSIGRAFAIQPDLLLLDEPFYGLDENLKRDMQELLFSLGQWHACTTVMVTHDVKEALRLADRIIVVVGRPCQVMLDLYPEPDQRYEQSYTKQMEQILLDAINPVISSACQ